LADLFNVALDKCLSPPQTLLKNMKFEGIEIALEVSGMKTTAENRCAGEGKERKK
jgi:hypothetical protein